MSAKDVKFGSEARNSMLKGVNTLANAVKFGLILSFWIITLNVYPIYILKYKSYKYIWYAFIWVYGN